MRPFDSRGEEAMTEQERIREHVRAYYEHWYQMDSLYSACGSQRVLPSVMTARDAACAPINVSLCRQSSARLMKFSVPCAIGASFL